jgi:hypothetical protein
VLSPGEKMTYNKLNLLKSSIFLLFVLFGFISNLYSLSKNTYPLLHEVLKKVEQIKTYHVVLNTKIFPLMLNDGDREKQEKLKNRKQKSNSSIVFGESYKKMRVASRFNMLEFNTKVDILMVFDGTWQWIEKKISKYENDKIVDQNVSAAKINISATAKDLQNEPFNTSYGISGIGLFKHKDLPGTLETILSRYDFDDRIAEIKGTKSQEIFIGRLIDDKKNEQLKANSREKKLTEIEKKNTQICKIWVGKKDRLIHGFSLGSTIDNPSIHTEIEYKSLNQPLPENIFLYIPPDGIKVKDITKQILQIRQKNEK